MIRTLFLLSMLAVVFFGGYFFNRGHPEPKKSLNSITTPTSITEWETAMAAGNAALNERNFTEAGRQFSLAIALTQGQSPYPILSKSLTGLAAVYREKNRLVISEETYLRALTITEQATGLVHPDVAMVLIGLAKTVYAQGRDTEAEALYDRALDIRMEILGKNR